ncbi:MAG: hypothetical protein KJO82_14725, partial [Gammaproteobacteria bacterium]|nr:hypothetical protein [Gammaproteobacteria bacterium]
EIRESMALSLQAENALATGDAGLAFDLIAAAISKSVRAPTRYLFARCRMEIQRGDIEAAAASIAEIRSHALPADDPDRTEDKAALYLEGLVDLHNSKFDSAIDTIRRAIDTEGYRYAIYQLGLARALLAGNQAEEALRHAGQARMSRDAGNIRLDLERDRAMAQLLEIRLTTAAGDSNKAGELIQDYERRWGRAELDAMQAGPVTQLTTGID